MLKAETNSSQKFSNMKTSEFLTSLIDMTPKPEEADLRGQLLHARKNGERLTLPENTVAVETDSSIVLNDAFSSELLDQVTAIMQKYPDSFSSIGEESDPFQFTRFDEDKKLTDLRAEMEEKNETLHEGSFKLTFLYREHQDEDIQESPLSAVLVFGEPTVEQIEALREKLPADVPLLSGMTNELLDNVGRKERQEAEHAHRVEFFLATLALQALNDELRHTYHTTTNTESEYEERDTKGSFKHDKSNRQYEDFKEDSEYFETRKNFWEEDRHSEPKSSYDDIPSEEATQEPTSLNLEQSANELLDTEAQKLGHSSWRTLDRKSLDRVKGRIARKIYSGQENANNDLFAVVSGLVAKQKGPLPFRDNPEDNVPN